MNWIGTWCKARCERGKDCDSCYEQCIPRMRIANEVGCSEGLIWILMNEAGGVTHHSIADRIADYLGATSEQRDSIVHKSHHGTYKPNTSVKPSHFRTIYNEQTSKAVLAIDRLGNVVKRYESIGAAAAQFRMHSASITYRCNRLYTSGDEFDDVGFALRFEADWNAMTYEEKMNDIKKKERCICSNI